MVHVFFYLNGLDGKVGDLMCMPRSQNAVMERPAFNQLWQDYELPGSLTFGSKNPLPPGSAVIVHSALLHGRRAQPGGDPNKPRYFIDISCTHEQLPSGCRSCPKEVAAQIASPARAAGLITGADMRPSARSTRSAWTWATIAAASTRTSSIRPSLSSTTERRTMRRLR